MLITKCQRPKKKSQPGRSSLLKVQPTDNPGPVGSSQLRGRSDACFLIDIHASIKAGAEWIMYTNDATERTTSLSRHSSFLSLSASLPGAQKKSGLLTPLSLPPPLPTLPPLFFHILPLSVLHSRTPGQMYAFGLTYTLPLLPSFSDATPDIDVPISTAVSALTHLEQAIDDMHSASPQSLSFDPLFYLALSSLPLTYPWPILTIDLKNFLPLMDRHVLTHLVAAQASVNPRFQHPGAVLSSFFKDLAHAVVHTILAPIIVFAPTLKLPSPPIFPLRNKLPWKMLGKTTLCNSRTQPALLLISSYRKLTKLPPR